MIQAPQTKSEVAAYIGKSALTGKAKLSLIMLLNLMDDKTIQGMAAIFCKAAEYINADDKAGFADFVWPIIKNVSNIKD
jgi:hypothetical protein